jgi:hypothetical protein
MIRLNNRTELTLCIAGTSPLPVYDRFSYLCMIRLNNRTELTLWYSRYFSATCVR